MTQITNPLRREIITDFAKTIQKKKIKSGTTPSKEVIEFRNERQTGKERTVVKVPINLLLYRKDNGRIASDVSTYERIHQPLDEKTEEAQEKLASFLEKKDPEKTIELINSIKVHGQRQPAIITADGFLINGNRRRLAFQKLLDETGKDKYKYMKVVILPGEDDEGGSPTLQEIEEIENRYQLQSDGKSEYTKFDRALSIRRKEENDYPLEKQLKDNPDFAVLNNKEFENKVKEYREDYLGTLKRIDEYLEATNREGVYNCIQEGVGDPEGRWQAFYDFNKYFYKRLKSAHWLEGMGLEEGEEAKAIDIAYKLIRKREFSGIKLHKIMRELHKWMCKERAREQLLKLNEIDINLPKDKQFDENDNEYDERTKDRIWGSLHNEVLHHRVNEARRCYQYKDTIDKPIDLLEQALKKLNHDEMDPEKVDVVNDLERAIKITQEIQKRANALESNFFNIKKRKNKLADNDRL